MRAQTPIIRLAAFLLVAAPAIGAINAPPAYTHERAPLWPQERVEGESSLRIAPEPSEESDALFAISGPVTSWIEKAETLDHVVVSPSQSYPVVQTEVVAEGTSAFQLINDSFADIALEIAPTIAPEAHTRLYFQSRLGLATSSQIAHAQIRVGSGSWNDLWSLAGSSEGYPSQDAFELITVDLSGYAGQTVSIRFFFEFTSGSAYTQLFSGWFIDNIQIGNAFEPDLYDGFGDPTAEEILLVEYINRARADANAEAVRLRDTTDSDVLSALSYFDVNTTIMLSQFATLTQTTQPLAINAMLTASSRSHSEDMLANAFQGHYSSSSPIPPNEPGDSPGMRADRQGFGLYIAENIFSFAESVWHAHAGFNIDWGASASTGLSIGGMQDPPGHRNNLHNPDHREIGVGVIHGSNGGVGPILVTEDMGFRDGFGGPFLVGVTIVDANKDAFYDLGEGLGAVSVSVEGAAFYATSSTHGTYAIPMPGDGAYTVTFSRSGYAPKTVPFEVVDGMSVKIDYLAVSEVVLQNVSLPNASTIRLTVSYVGSADDLEVEMSQTLATWASSDASITPLGDNLYQIDFARGAALEFLRVLANP